MLSLLNTKSNHVILKVILLLLIRTSLLHFFFGFYLLWSRGFYGGLPLPFCFFLLYFFKLG